MEALNFALLNSVQHLREIVDLHLQYRSFAAFDCAELQGAFTEINRRDNSENSENEVWTLDEFAKKSGFRHELRNNGAEVEFYR